MNKILKVHFHRKYYKWWNPIKYTTSIIKLFSNDTFYHVSFEANKKYYEAEFFKGCNYSNYSRDDIAYTIKLIINETSFKKIIAEYNKMLGSKYDFFGVLFGFFGYKIQSKRKYFCSELFLPILKHAYQITKNDLKTNLSPKDVRMICLGINAKNAK